MLLLDFYINLLMLWDRYIGYKHHRKMCFSQRSFCKVQQWMDILINLGIDLEKPTVFPHRE